MPLSQTIPRITLEQWAAFRAVVDEGSYAKAAEALNKSQSTISYALARLDDLLPSPALRLEGRKAVLTETGKVLYRHATVLLNQARAMEKAAAYLASGWESEVVLVVEVLAPMDVLLGAMQQFSVQSPLTRIKILETTLSGTDEALLSGEGQLAIMARVPPGFLGNHLYDVRMIPVARPDHPLFALGHPASETELREHRQLVLRDSGVKRQQDAGWLGSEQRWTVSHFATTVEALKAGLGFAFVPHHRVRGELQRGELAQLSLETGGIRVIPLYLVIAEPDFAGPATRALAETLNAGFAVQRSSRLD